MIVVQASKGRLLADALFICTRREINVHHHGNASIITNANKAITIMIHMAAK